MLVLHGPWAMKLWGNKMAGKNLRKAYEAIDRSKLYKVSEAVAILKKSHGTKFDQTIDVAMNLNIDPRKADQNVRGMVSLPNGTGKTIRVAVFAKDKKAEEAKAAGADIVGAEELMEQIQKGEMNFDRCIATPDMMALVGRVGKLLGPKGLMPNPKLGTVTVDVEKAVKDAKGGQTEYRAEKNGIIHGGVGRISFEESKIEENVKAFTKAVFQARPSGAKGTYVKSAFVSSTMGPSLKLDLADLS